MTDSATFATPEIENEDTGEDLGGLDDLLASLRSDDEPTRKRGRSKNFGIESEDRFRLTKDSVKTFKAINLKRRSALASLLGATLATTLYLPSPSHGKSAKCYLSVNGRTYINGICQFDFIGNDGSFSFDDSKLKTQCIQYDLGNGQCSNASRVITQKGTFGQLQVIGTGRARVFWNEGRALHAQESLGLVTRNGACWQNSTVKLCAW